MEHFIDEKTVMRFYLECMDEDGIVFLQGRDELKKSIRKSLEALIEESKMNNKIQIAIGLWKSLFEAAMSHISPNKKGYDKIFKYFDSYVEFEELIFASDSFYRDHTLHCLWVYFLGEYLYRVPEFSDLFKLERDIKESYELMEALASKFQIVVGQDARILKSVIELVRETGELKDSSRCIAALTHDLGYPLKKIEKINKSINKVLPYFAINNFENFSFEYENIQQEFANSFIDFIARHSEINITPKADMSDEVRELLNKKVFVSSNYSEEDISTVIDRLDTLPEKEKELLKGSFEVEVLFHAPFSQKVSYYNDFEAYQHGIMSAFLLMKNMQAFQDIDYCKPGAAIPIPDAHSSALQDILASISNHTSDSYRIKRIDGNSFLTFVDELEEFSRISRASQNREYVEEFCDTALYMEDGWLNVVFEFNNQNLDNLDPEISFKGRCKRFLSLFDIENLDRNLKIRVTIVGKLPTDDNEYVLEIARNYADIRINGESKNIPKYLKSTQFLTKEEYAQKA